MGTYVCTHNTRKERGLIVQWNLYNVDILGATKCPDSMVTPMGHLIAYGNLGPQPNVQFTKVSRFPTVLSSRFHCTSLIRIYGICIRYTL